METGRKTDCESRTSAASELLARCGVRADGAVVGRARQETLERKRDWILYFSRALSKLNSMFYLEMATLHCPLVVAAVTALIFKHLLLAQLSFSLSTVLILYR